MTSQTQTFKVGDVVQPRGGTQTLTVLWVSKCGSLISTEANGYCHTTSWASCYEAVRS